MSTRLRFFTKTIDEVKFAHSKIAAH
jgi:hypothetical protein